MAHKFKIGDRVICVSEYDGNQEIVGMTGTVCGPMRPDWCGVVYDSALTRGHDCRGNCDAPYGWETSYACLELYEDSANVVPAMAYEELNI